MRAACRSWPVTCCSKSADAYHPISLFILEKQTDFCKCTVNYFGGGVTFPMQIAIVNIKTTMVKARHRLDHAASNMSNPLIMLRWCPPRLSVARVSLGCLSQNEAWTREPVVPVGLVSNPRFEAKTNITFLEINGPSLK